MVQRDRISAFSKQMRVGVLAVLLVTCSTQTPSARPTVRPPADARIVRELPAGTLLRLGGATSSDSSTGPAVEVIDGWWRLAMEQSARFDVATGSGSPPSSFVLDLGLDRASGVFTTTLRAPGAPALPLAAATVHPTGGFAAALDELAWRTRVGLGEVPDVATVPCARAYSEAPQCVLLAERGRRDLQDGDLTAARRVLERARQHDGGCPVVLLHLGTVLLALPEEGVTAARIAQEALGYQARLTPQTEHRLARLALEARGDHAALLELGRAYRSDRPFDPHGRYSEGLALARSGDYPAALPLLEGLRVRWPRAAPLHRQLAFARLATGDAEGALAALDDARRGLPAPLLARLQAMALYHAGHHAELNRFLADLRRRPGVAGQPAEHEVIRMQASHAILTEDRDAAIAHLVDSLDWCRRHSSSLEAKALPITEDGEVLVRLDATQQLTAAIDAFHDLGELPGAVAQGLTYLGGLLRIRRDEHPDRALRTLSKAADDVLWSRLQAAVHHHRGELEAESTALRAAAARSNHPLVYATYARSLDASGQRDDAVALMGHLRKTLLAFHQDAPREHPLMTPGRALAFLVTR